MHYIKASLLFTACIGLAGMLGGCETMTQRTRYPQSSNYTVQPFSKVLNLRSEGRTSQENITGVLRPILSGYSEIGNMQFVITKGTDPTALSFSAVANALQAMEISHNQISKNEENPGKHTKLRLIGYTVVPPAQHGWNFPPKSYESVNTNLFNGSTVNANRGAIIANPRNETDRRPMAPADGRYHERVVNSYRGEVGSEQPDTNASTPPSSSEDGSSLVLENAY